MRGNSLRSKKGLVAQPRIYSGQSVLAGLDDPLEGLLHLNNNGLKGNGFSSPGLAGGRQRPSSAHPRSGGGVRMSAQPFPPGMMGIIGQSKATTEMQSAVRSVGLKRPASAAITGRWGSTGANNTQQASLEVGLRSLQGLITAAVPMGQSAEDYIPIKKLGQGASGIVYLVRLKDQQDQGQQQLYVLKQVEIGKSRGQSAPSSERFSAIARHERDGVLREVRLMASIDSPHLIRYITSFFGPSSGGASSCMHIIMQYADGGSLAELLRKTKQLSKSLPEAQVWKCLIQIASGLSAMHAHRVIHRDIKPGNILLCNGDYKIADLGIAVDTSSSNVQGRMRTGRCGTPCYMPPEVSNDLPYDGRVDVWSLGCVLYEMCTNRLAFPGGTLHDAGTRAENGMSYAKVEELVGDLQLPPSCSDEINDHVLWCLSVDPTQRPTSAQILGTRTATLKMLELPCPAKAPMTPPKGSDDDRKVFGGAVMGRKGRERPVSAPVARRGGFHDGGAGQQPPKTRGGSSSHAAAEESWKSHAAAEEQGSKLFGHAAAEEEQETRVPIHVGRDQYLEGKDEGVDNANDGLNEPEGGGRAGFSGFVGGVTISRRHKQEAECISSRRHKQEAEPERGASGGLEMVVEGEGDRSWGDGGVDKSLDETSYDFVRVGGALGEAGGGDVSLYADAASSQSEHATSLKRHLPLDSSSPGAPPSAVDATPFSPTLASVQDPPCAPSPLRSLEANGSHYDPRPLRGASAWRDADVPPIGGASGWVPAASTMRLGEKVGGSKIRPSSGTAASRAGSGGESAGGSGGGYPALESFLSTGGATIQTRPLLRPASAHIRARVPVNRLVRPASASHTRSAVSMNNPMIVTALGHKAQVVLGPRHVGNGMRPRIVTNGGGFVMPGGEVGRGKGANEDLGNEEDEELLVEDDDDDDDWEGMKVEANIVAEALGGTSGGAGALLAASSLATGHRGAGAGAKRPASATMGANRFAPESVNRPASASVNRPASASILTKTSVRTPSASIADTYRPTSASRTSAPMHVITLQLSGSDIEVDEVDEDSADSDVEGEAWQRHLHEGAEFQMNDKSHKVRKQRPASAYAISGTSGAGRPAGALPGGGGGQARPASAKSPISTAGVWLRPTPTNSRRESAKGKVERMAAAGAERRLMAYLQRVLSHSLDCGKPGVPMSSLPGIIQAQLGVPANQQRLSGPDGQRISLSEYVVANPSIFTVGDDGLVSLANVGARSGENASSASRRILSRMGLQGRQV